MEAVASGVRFLLELCALAALAYWGWQTGDGRAQQVALAAGAPLVAAVVWGTFVAPNAPLHIDEPWRLVPEVAVFGAAVAALASAGRPFLAVAFAVIAVLDRIALAIWES
jgi:hypothetical protein